MSTLNFVVHLWYIMRAFVRGATVLEPSKRTLVLLLISPYVLAFIPVAGLFYPPGIIFGIRADFLIKPCFLALTIITILFDIDLVALCWRYRAMLLRQEEVSEAIPPRSMQVKFLLLCSIRLVLSAFCMIDLIQPQQNDRTGAKLILLVDGIYPFLVSMVIGTKMLPVAKFGRWFGAIKAGCFGVQKFEPEESRSVRGVSECRSAVLTARGSLNDSSSVIESAKWSSHESSRP